MIKPAVGAAATSEEAAELHELKMMLGRSPRRPQSFACDGLQYSAYA